MRAWDFSQFVATSNLASPKPQYHKTDQAGRNKDHS
jgi:hypothetical protein